MERRQFLQLLAGGALGLAVGVLPQKDKITTGGQAAHFLPQPTNEQRVYGIQTQISPSLRNRLSQKSYEKAGGMAMAAIKRKIDECDTGEGYITVYTVAYVGSNIAEV